MEAKDTVIKLENISNESLRIQMEKILETQAKITWLAAVKEVVEWVSTHKLYAGNISIPSKVWQAQLKDWGIRLL